MEYLRSSHHTLNEKLYALSPLSVLDRGYSITRRVSDQKVVRRNDQVEERQLLEIILSKGGLEVSVARKIDTDIESTGIEERHSNGNTDV
jgi:exodeoxyribonuclease VII large subunit